ncbi:MAG: hypothetical protein ACI4SM_00250, partial [Candidatus Gastranaerophilaceae bacterium]
MPNVNNDIRVKMPIQAKAYAKNVEEKKQPETKNLSNAVMDKLSATANINKVNIMTKQPEKFELNLSTEELEKRTNKDFLAPKVLLKSDSKEYANLAEGDKQALKHLVKTAKIIDTVYMKMDNEKNLEFKDYLEKEAAKGNKDAEMSLILFNAQKGISGIDMESKMVTLAKGQEERPGKAFYPADLKKEEFHNILIKMLENGEKDEVAKILNQRSIVERDGDKLKAVDYCDKFKEEFTQIADELDAAAEVSTNKDFNEYLKLQAKALRTADPMLDAYADKKWATLQDTPLEYTITREQYADRMTGSVVENEKLNKMLQDAGIVPQSKDSLGCRVGIVNKQGTDDLLAIKKYLPMLAEHMPLADQYKQTISASGDAKQTMVDVDLVSLTGDGGAYRGGVTLAENLPNGDKLSLTIGGGRRNVYHRQIRTTSQPEKIQKRLDAVLDPKFHKLYNEEADHWFTIGHENAHSLGPKEGDEGLGKYRNIVEENKADMGSLSFLDDLVKEGMYTPEQKDQILVNFATNTFLKSKPTMDQAHRVRSVMQANYFIREGAISVSDDGKISVNLEKMVPTAKKMLTEIIKVQLSGDMKQAEDYINTNFYWNEKNEAVAKNLREVNKTLNGVVESPLQE